MGMGIIMSVCLGFLCYYAISAQTINNYKEDLVNDTMAVRASINHYHEEIEELLRRIADSEEVRKYSESYRQTLLLKYFDSFKEQFDLLAYVNPQGRIEFMLVNDRTSGTGENLAEDLYYRRSVEQPDKIHISSLEFIEELGSFGFYYNFLNTNYFDEQIALIRGANTLESLQTIAEQALVDTSDTIVITDRRGRVISSPDQEDLGTSAASADHRLYDLYSTGTGQDIAFPEATFNGHSHKFIMATHPELGWKIFATVSLARINEPVARLRNYIIAVSLFIVALAELLSRFMGLQITEPIGRLNHLALSIVRSGRLSDRVDWQSRDELGDLARSFNLMLDQLEDSTTQLIEERQFSDNIINSVIDGMATVAVDGTIIKANTFLKKLLQYEEDQIIGLPCSALFPSTDQPLDPENRILLAEKGFLRISHTHVLSRDGGRFPCDVNISVINDTAGTPVALLFVIIDIREKIKLEDEKNKTQERLRQTSEELLQTEKIAAIGQTAGMIAHEVLNPLTAVNTRVELNLKKSGDMARVIETMNSILEEWREKIENGNFQGYLQDSGEKDFELLARIARTLATRQFERTEDYRFLKEQVGRILKIIDGMREMAKPEKTITRISLRELLDDVLKDMQDGLRKRMITVEKKYITCPEIYADYMEIYSILTNTIKNAMQAIEKKKNPPERKIIVKLEKLPYDEALITISDTGIGMDRSTRKSVFTPGFTQKGREGTGIGASLSRKLARRYGGDMKIKQSKPGEGTTVEIILARGANDI